LPLSIKLRAQGLKPCFIPRYLRGPEGPLFHRATRVLECFRNPLEGKGIESKEKEQIPRSSSPAAPDDSE
jgi:hypothetical protein